MGLLGKKKEEPAGDKVVMDLGDFVAQEYVLSFTINSNKYRFEYTEVSVDEILSLMYTQQEAGGEDKTPDFRDTIRQRVVGFLQKFIVEGDPEKLAEDLQTVPYMSKRGALDIKSIFERIMNRVKKNPTIGETA